MRRTFTLQVDWSAPGNPEATEYDLAMAYDCWVCGAPAGVQCPDDPDDEAIVYAQVGPPPFEIRFHEGRPLRLAGDVRRMTVAGQESIPVHVGGGVRSFPVSAGASADEIERQLQSVLERSAKKGPRP